MLAGRCHPARGHMQLAWAFAEVLTCDAGRAEALFQAAVLETRVAPSGAGRPTHRLLATVREVFYRGEGGARPGDEGRAEAIPGCSTALGRAVGALADEDRELLFLRFGAGLGLPDIGRISGRMPEAARARIAELCAGLDSRLAHRVPVCLEAAGRPTATVH